jgi:hypothetical protein
MLLGTSQDTMAEWGCFETSFTMGLCSVGIETDPGQCLTLLNANGVEDANGEFEEAKVGLAYPNIKCTDSQETTLNADQLGKITPQDAVARIQAAMADPLSFVLLHVYLGKEAHACADHFVLLTDCSTPSWKINDPEQGAILLCSPAPGFVGYGATPEACIYGYRRFTMTPSPASIELQAAINKAFAVTDAKHQQIDEFVAANWPMLVNAVTNLGYTDTDIVNYIYGFTHKGQKIFNLLNHK